MEVAGNRVCLLSPACRPPGGSGEGSSSGCGTSDGPGEGGGSCEGGRGGCEGGRGGCEGVEGEHVMAPPACPSNLTREGSPARPFSMYKKILAPTQMLMATC
jgi:hypothetical protein